MGGFGELAAQFDQVNRKRKGDQFEIVCKWFLENDPTYQILFRHVWLWNEWPQRWPVEAGIDLVAEDREGKLWAVQAKAEADQVTHDGVAHFLAEAGRAEFANLMLIATTDRIHHIGERTMRETAKPVTIVRLSDLESSEVDWPDSLQDLRPAPTKPKGPWPHQEKAIENVLRGFETGDRGQLVMACGTGKTLTALFLKERLAAQRTLVLVPSLSLLKQTLREWTASKSADFDFRAVCSDETVAKEDLYDAALSRTVDLGVPVTTVPGEIAAFLRQESIPLVVLATYQSSGQIAEAFKLAKVPAFDLVIADEAHRVAGSIKSDFGTVLHQNKIKATRRLFMTATPRYFTGRTIRAARESDDEIASMDDRSKFGVVFHRLGFGEAIEQELLTDYRVVIVDVDDATYLDWAERGHLVKLNGERTDARSLAGQIGLAKSMRKYDLRRVISFHSRVKTAKGFADAMPAVLDWMPAQDRPDGKLWSKHASGAMSAGERHVLLEHLKKLDGGDRALLANARCLAEGVDVPALDGVAFIDPRRSEVDIIQAVGRAIRRSDTKTVGTIIIPIFIGSTEDPEAALDDSAFKPVWDVVRALRAHDDQLGRQLDDLRRELGHLQRGRLKLPSKIHHDLSPSVSEDFARAFDVRLVNSTTASWEFWFGILERYVASNATARIPKDERYEGYPLGAWVATQRLRREGLHADREARLTKLPGWSWNTHIDAWEDGYKRVLSYLEREGTAAVKTDYVDPDGYRLGSWVQVQRLKRDSLERERYERLNDLRGWTWDSRAGAWEEGYSRLLAYAEHHGTSFVKKDYVEADGYRLGTWVQVQRLKRDGLQPDRLERLGKLPGWTWDPIADAWEEGYRRLLSYVEREGTSAVKRDYVEPDGYALGSWVKNQRLKRDRMQRDRLELLSRLPGWAWDPIAEAWEGGYRRLLAYVEREGTSAVKRDYVEPDGYALGSWAASQRKNRDRLDPDRLERLGKLLGWTWDPFSDAWEEGFNRVLAYLERHGTSAVKRSYIESDGYRLGSWAQTQRVKRDRLDSSRAERLSKLPGWTWNPFDDSWEDGYARIVAYVERHGTAEIKRNYIDPDGFRLGDWVTEQRTQKKNGKLKADREERLVRLSGWVWPKTTVEKWEDGFRRLESFVKQHNSAMMRDDYVEEDGHKLGMWVRNQKSRHSAGRLDPERIKRLEVLKGWSWSTRRR